ncbi:MAG: DUF3604 domain-containing protein, partial [Gammaproteobacteria bacterium]
MNPRSLSFLAILSLTACSDKAPEPESPDVAEGQRTADTVPVTATASGEITRNPLRNAYFGNLHVHTQWSFDAYINGAIADPDGAYRWAKGESIPGGGDGTPLQ